MTNFYENMELDRDQLTTLGLQLDLLTIELPIAGPGYNVTSDIL